MYMAEPRSMHCLGQLSLAGNPIDALDSIDALAADTPELGRLSDRFASLCAAGLYRLRGA